jgi:hypothetical protein
MYNQRKTMTKAELDKDAASQEARIRRNEETMKKAESADTGPNSLGAAVKELGGMANRGLKQDLDEISKVRGMNSREQYMHEKKQGGPMTDLSYEEWKKL